MTKALLHELGKSLSYGRLSLKAKVLWPMLLASSDDQGRGLAEDDAVKWYVCPNVPEIAVADVAGLLAEMCAQNMIVIYDTDRGQVYQVVRWWEFQQLRWARPSKHPAPSNWTDRIRYSNRGDLHTEHWDEDGGFCTVFCTENPRDFQPNLTQLNSTQLNSTQPIPHVPADAGADAPPATPSTFEDWQEAIRTSKNRPATLVWMFKTLYTGSDPPDYGRVGKTARAVGGAGRLAELMWHHSTRPPTGDVLAYLQKCAKGHATGPPRDNGKTPAQLAAEDFLAEEAG